MKAVLPVRDNHPRPFSRQEKREKIIQHDRVTHTIQKSNVDPEGQRHVMPIRRNFRGYIQKKRPAFSTVLPSTLRSGVIAGGSAASNQAQDGRYGEEECSMCCYRLVNMIVFGGCQNK